MVAFAAVCILSTASVFQVAGTPQTAVTPAATQQSVKRESNASSPTAEIRTKLLSTKRIYVDSFGDDPISKQMQAMVITALTESGRFVVTENKEKADAILKGVALEKTSQEFHALNDSAAVSTAAGGHSGSVSGTFVNGTGSVSGSSSGGFAARSVAADGSVASTETINDARTAVRLVSPDGDVLWSTTQESKGAKYKSASADVASKIVKQLMRDLEKLEKSGAAE